MWGGHGDSFIASATHEQAGKDLATRWVELTFHRAGTTVAPDVHKITQETLDKLKVEFEHLTTVGRNEIARTIESARLLGDLSENGDYHAAKDDQGKMEARIRHLDQIIRNHEIIEKDDSGVASHASIVTVLYEGDDPSDAQDYFLGSIEEKPEGIPVASETSPLGAALLGRTIGDVVEYEAPSGPQRITITAIR
jgi:transcription elongation factor GreA